MRERRYCERARGCPTGIRSAGPTSPCWAAALRRLTVPALVIWGGKDQVLDADKQSRQLARDLAIPPDRVVVLADANHFLQEDRGPEVADRIAAFVAAT